MAPRHSSRFSRSREPFSAAAATPPRQKYVFPLVNTPVRRSRENCENFPPENSSSLSIANPNPNSSPFSEVKPSPSLARSSSKPKPSANLSLPLPSRNALSRPSPISSVHTVEVTTTTTNMALTVDGNENPGNAKRKLNLEALQPAKESSEHDHGVNIMIRIRPGNSKEATEEATEIVEKLSETSLSLSDHQFTFDRIAGGDTSQQGMFQMVGLPFVENCLKGFNSSLFTYGQTGSGKTYTMWGPTEGLIQRSMEEKGLAPRVFECLFLRIKEEEEKHKGEPFTYQCRCSFLEIYNEQITDLLEPSQKNLQIREDTKMGVYVENLTEEYVSCVEDVFSLILKGLGNRKIGSTSMNSDSSRSHTVFICTIESRCKSANGVSCVKTSRMNLVDLAGSERQKSTRAAGQRLKEAGNINRSLSQLGNVINILAEMSQTGKPRHIPYRDSRLTFLLQESLGGNAKLAVICTISPMSSCKNETLSTLRFAQRAKAIKNEAMVNEKTEDEVQSLREQIRQLKDELMKMKNEIPSNGLGNATSLWNARRSYNLLRMSLKRSMILPHPDSDSDEDMEFEDAEDGSYASPPKNQDEVALSNDKKSRPLNLSDGELNAEDSECRASKKGRLLNGSDNPTSPTCIGNSEVIPSDDVEEGAICMGLEPLKPRQLEDENKGRCSHSVLASSEFAAAIESHLPQISFDSSNGNENSHMSECEIFQYNAEATDQIQVAVSSPSTSMVKSCPQVPVLSVSPSFQEVNVTSSCKGSFFTDNAGTVPMEDIEIDQYEQSRALNGSLCGEENNKSLSSSTKGLVASPGIENSDMCECDTLCYNGDAAEAMQLVVSPSSSILKGKLQVPTLCVSPRVQEIKKVSPGIVSASTSNIQAVPNKSVQPRAIHRSLCIVDNNGILPVKSKSLSSPTERLAASLYRGLQILENHQKKIANNRASYTSSFSLQNLSKSVVDKSVQTSPMMSPKKMEPLHVAITQDIGLLENQTFDMLGCDAIAHENPSMGSQCHEDDPSISVEDTIIGKCDEYTNTDYASVDTFADPSTVSQCHQDEYDKPTCTVVGTEEPSTGPQCEELQNLKDLLAGALRRECAAEEALNKKNMEIEQLNRLVNQYKHERGCNAVLQESGELKMARLQNLMEGTMPTDAFMHEQWASLVNEHKILQGKYDRHPDVTQANLAQHRLNEELEKYRNFYDCGERDELLREISQLKSKLHDSLDKNKLVGAIPEEEYEKERSSSEQKFTSMISELMMQVEDYKRIAEQKETELEGEHRCANEMKEALQVAMEGHARLLDQYAELQEKHIRLLAKHRKMREAIADARKKGGKMGCFRGKWFEAQAAELAAIKVEQEQERKRAKEQIEELQAQVHDTADAVQAAGELLVRLREAYESVLVAEDAAELAAQDVEKLHRENERLKRKHSTEIATMQQRLMEARFQKTTVCPMCLMAERVKFQFPEVNADEAQAAMEAEQLAAGDDDDQYEEDEKLTSFT